MIKGKLGLEYPSELRFVEMSLVKMIKSNRSWDDIVQIINALDAVQRMAEDLNDERNKSNPQNSAGGAVAVPMPWP